VLAVLLGTGAIWALAHATGASGPMTAVLALVAGTAVLAPGLSGPDAELDRTAAFRWAPRRAGHAIGIGAVTVGTVLAGQALTGDFATFGFAARDAAGLLGLVALTAVALGGQYAWTVACAWFTFVVFVPESDDTTYRVLAWMLQPAGTTAATWTALTLGAAGTAAYAAFGPRR
jgi:hypothetical protein